jgi:hypothetical protein
MPSMQTRAAVENLRSLKEEAEQQKIQLKPPAKFASWQGLPLDVGGSWHSGVSAPACVFVV